MNMIIRNFCLKKKNEVKLNSMSNEWFPKEDYSEDEEYLACVQDILNHKLFQSMDQYIQHGNTTCKAHCLKVSYISYCICRQQNWNYCAAARAGLLHDFFLYDWHSHAKDTGQHFHGFTHPRVAMDNAERVFRINDMEKDIILRHMWPLTPIPPKSKEGFSILYADKFCGLAEIIIHIKKVFLGENHDILGKITK